MRPGALTLAATAVAVVCLTVGRLAAVPPLPPLAQAAFAELDAWLGLVAAHVPGERDAAADTASRLSDDDLGVILAQLQEARALLDQARAGRVRPSSRLATTAGTPTDAAALVRLFGIESPTLGVFLGDQTPAGRAGLDAAIGRRLARGALLHGDAAIVVPAMLRLVREDDPDARATLRVTDGRADGIERGAESHVTLHLRFGNRLMELASVRAPDRAALEAWYRGVAVVQLHYEMYGDALRHLEDARRVLPDDGEVLFYSGVLHEVFASPRTQSVIQSLELPAGMVHDLRGTMDELRRAERFYRAALGHDPGLVPAAVRHGRVLNQLGAHQEALATLERIRARIVDRPTQYFAALFLGDARAALADPEGAARAYTEAAVLYPRAQTPALLRSALARAAGDRDRAVTLLAETLGHPVDPTTVVDPWRTYGTAHVADVEARLNTLRRALAGGAAR